MEIRDRFDYSAIVDRPPLRLPDGARVAVVTVINVENWDIAEPMPRQVLTTPAGVRALPDVPNWAWHEYGMRIGFWRMKDVFDRHGVKPTVSINASVCLDYPRVAAAMRESGWEFMGHGFKQKAMHALDDQREAVRRTVSTIADFIGRPPRGWLGPGLTETVDTLDILAEEGIEYVCDWVMDDQPFEIRTRTKTLVSIPYSVELNDIPMMITQHHESRVLYERTMEHFQRLHAEGAEQARIMAICVHPYISGVPHRIGYFERIYKELSKRAGVLFWTGEQVLDWYRASR